MASESSRFSRRSWRLLRLILQRISPCRKRLGRGSRLDQDSARHADANVVARESFLKLPVNPPGKNIRRPAVGVVGGIVDELVVRGQSRRGSERIAVIGLDDLFGRWMRQHPVAYQYA